MIYVVDKNTNRIVFAAEDGPYFIDDYTYKFEGPAFDFGGLSTWAYRVENAQIVLAPVPAKPKAKQKTVVNSTR